MKTPTQIAAEAWEELHPAKCPPTDRQKGIAIIKAAIEEAKEEGFEECRRLWVRAEADWKSRAAQAGEEKP